MASSASIGYHLGVGGISMPFIILSTLLTPLAVGELEGDYAWCASTDRLSRSGDNDDRHVRLARHADVLSVLKRPDPEIHHHRCGATRGVSTRPSSSFSTLLGSVLMLVHADGVYRRRHDRHPGAERAVCRRHADLAFPRVRRHSPSGPMWPSYFRCPVEAPTGLDDPCEVLLKMGGYGFIRFSLPMFPLASKFFAPLIFAMSIIAIVYTSLVALAQSGMADRLFIGGAYGVRHHRHLHPDRAGVAGAIFQMISHGLVSAALFFCVGVVYDRLHTRGSAPWRCRG